MHESNQLDATDRENRGVDGLYWRRSSIAFSIAA